MLSRCGCISRTSAWGRSINSLNNVHARNHHAIGNALFRLNRSDQNEKSRIQTSPLNQMVLSQISAPSNFVSARNLSFIPSIFASSKEEAAVSAATATVKAPEIVDSLQIPDVPAVPIDGTFVQQLAANGEPTFSSLGLGGYSPIGVLQWALEFMHVSLDLPWYATIALSTVIIRILLTPLVVISQRNAVIMRNVLPEMQDVQNRISEARQMGNAIEYAQANQELTHMMKNQGFNPLKNMLIPFAQMPIFLSYFIGIRRMVNAPVESMQTGGMLWFTDLTLADPYYLLPLITSATLALTIHLGTDAVRVPGQDTPMVTILLKAIPIIIFPFIMNFPAAMVVYWASSNFCSLIQGRLFKMPKVRTFFKIPQINEQPAAPVQEKKKQGIIQNAKGAWSNLKMSREIEDRRRLDQINFERAGTGPLVRTYKFDPTKVKKSN